MRAFALPVALTLTALVFACGSDTKSGGKTTPPTAATVQAVAKKPASHTSLGASTDQVSAGACAAANAGLCGCLPESEWYTDGVTIYDVVCCPAAGDALMLHACGATKHCDDAGSEVMCME